MSAPDPPQVRLSLGVTGHRRDNPAYAANRRRIADTLAEILDLIETTIAAAPGPLGPLAPTRLHCLLADGTDQLAAEGALARGWELVVPLPFGRALNAAINARPADAADARTLIAGGCPACRATGDRVRAIARLAEHARCFELAERDEAVATLLLDSLEAPGDVARAQAFAAAASERVALAGRVMIEQSDILIAIWDGVSRAYVGGTGHTIAAALDQGTPVVWIDARAPESWGLLQAPESLVAGVRPPVTGACETLARLVQEVVSPGGGRAHELARLHGLAAEGWPVRSSPIAHAYRRVEALFGGATWAQRVRTLRQAYESPDTIAAGSAAGLLAAAEALPGAPADTADRLEATALRRFAWADGVSANLSDRYRGGMTATLLLSPLAILGGLAWLPFSTPEAKWLFELVEVLLLLVIIGVTMVGQARRWHRRWFETRRVAEYLRHGPLMILMGVARPPGRWPRSADCAWPEWFARQALRDAGVPALAVTPAYLRRALETLLRPHVASQRDYHRGKAERLAAAHRNLDRVSETLFVAAIVVVAGYLGLEAAAALGLLSHAWPRSTSNAATYLGVLLPTLGAAVSGIRYFGDFERFAAISVVSAEKLDAVHARIQLLLSAPDAALDYRWVSDLAHAADDVVVSEIENWQAVFAGKHITVPV